VTIDRSIEPRLLLLLCGGDKSTQQRDIKNARRILKEWKDQDNG
jgi:putative component of toxin-antitoxin plasmid stabilization module